MADSYTKFFERGLFPLVDRLNGTSISEKLELLLESELLDAAEIRWRQEAALHKAVDRAKSSSRFYSRVWKNNPPGPPSEFEALDRLPIVTKKDLARGREDFDVSSHRGRIFTANTSGSTGVPLTFHRCAEQESWFWALRLRIWRWAGYHPGDPYLTINFNPRIQWKKRLQDKLFRCAYLTFNADNQDSAAIVKALRDRKITFLNGFSSSLFVLAKFMLENQLEDPTVTGITSTGDSLFPTYRDTIEKAFGTRVLDYYGAGGEGIHVASQCPSSGDRYHLHPENALVEILGTDGPVQPGERGRIIVTQFHNQVMPLIRYDLEDIAIPAPRDASCTCGRSLPMLEKIEGRAPDLVALPDGTFLVVHFFVVLFKNIQSIQQYQVVQDEKDRIRVRVVPRQGCDRQTVEQTVQDAVSQATRELISCDFEWLDEIPLSGAGKRRLVISSIGRQALGFDQTG